MHAPTDRKYFVYPFCVDGRKSFNGLCGIIRGELRRDPACGDVFVFLASSMSSIKLLFREHGGFVIYYKKMDRGRFEMPPLRVDGKGYYISEIQLLQIIRGVVFQQENQRVDHLPAYRQFARFQRAGIQIPYSTMLDWISRACRLLAPLYRLLQKEILKSDYLMMDETTMRVMDKNKRGKTHRGYFWAVQSPGTNLAFFEYHTGRGQEIPKKILRNYKGYLQSDGYVGYQNLHDNQNIRLMCCMAHARRYFSDAITNDPDRAEYAMEIFGKLYGLERNIKELNAEERFWIRQQSAKPIWEEFGHWLQKEIPKLKEKSAIYKAFAYTMSRFKKLAVYMEDPKLNIDNNPIEASIRSVAMGRNNFLFCGSHPAAQRSAMLYSFMASCKLHNMNPTVWLTDVLAKISNCPKNQQKQLLPHFWKKKQNNLKPVRRVREKISAEPLAS